MYLGLASLTLGVGLWMNTWWVILLLVPALILIDRFVIAREEAYLRRRFGAEYEEDTSKGAAVGIAAPVRRSVTRVLAAAALGVCVISRIPVTPRLLAHAQPPQRHAFTLGGGDFLLDGRPFQIISGEMHPARIPVEYWRHRIRLAKAMGLNTIAMYVFWNYHETREGVFDFTSGNRDIAQFVHLAQEEGLWVLLRPGYVCAEWDFGGIPPYLLADPELKDSQSQSA